MNGEGFAFFRWHHLKYGAWDMTDDSHDLDTSGGCYFWWADGARN